MRAAAALGLAAVLWGASGVGWAGDAAAGKAMAVVCVACHGQEGISIAPEYPNLAGQKEKYLVKSLRAYKNGERSDPTMNPMVMSLGDADIENLAAYYAQLGCK
jgi:cytochrome c553